MSRSPLLRHRSLLSFSLSLSIALSIIVVDLVVVVVAFGYTSRVFEEFLRSSLLVCVCVCVLVSAYVYPLPAVVWCSVAGVTEGVVSGFVIISRYLSFFTVRASERARLLLLPLLPSGFACVYLVVLVVVHVRACLLCVTISSPRTSTI